MDQVKIS